MPGSAGKSTLRMSKTRPIVFQALRPSKDARMLAGALEDGERIGMQAFGCYPIDASDPASQGVLLPLTGQWPHASSSVRVLLV